jgi:hypothetical protein
MNLWTKRAPEIAYLLNPAFCAIILYISIFEYAKKDGKGMPFPLLYLILPIILHQDTRNKVNSKTNMAVWLQRNSDASVTFPERARNLVVFTNEAIEFLLLQKIVVVIGSKLAISQNLPRTKIDRIAQSDLEMQECFKKAEHVGRWFYDMHSGESIYAAWGVKP